MTSDDHLLVRLPTRDHHLWTNPNRTVSGALSKMAFLPIVPENNWMVSKICPPQSSSADLSLNLVIQDAFTYNTAQLGSEGPILLVPGMKIILNVLCDRKTRLEAVEVWGYPVQGSLLIGTIHASKERSWYPFYQRHLGGLITHQVGRK